MPKEKEILHSVRVSRKAIRVRLLTGERMRPRGRGRREGARVCAKWSEEIRSAQRRGKDSPACNSFLLSP